MAGTLKNIYDSNNFNRYICDNKNELVYDIPNKYRKRNEMVNESLKLIHINDLCNIFSQETEEIISDHFNIFNEKFNCEKENNAIKLKFYFLLQLINITFDWRNDYNNNTTIYFDQIEKLNNILKKYDLQYHHSMNSFCDILVGNKLVDKECLTILIKFCNSISNEKTITKNK